MWVNATFAMNLVWTTFKQCVGGCGSLVGRIILPYKAPYTFLRMNENNYVQMHENDSAQSRMIYNSQREREWEIIYFTFHNQINEYLWRKKGDPIWQKGLLGRRHLIECISIVDCLLLSTSIKSYKYTTGLYFLPVSVFPIYTFMKRSLKTSFPPFIKRRRFTRILNLYFFL